MRANPFCFSVPLRQPGSAGGAQRDARRGVSTLWPAAQEGEASALTGNSSLAT
jgi:hypothetical protein